MKWFKENPFLSALLVITLIGAGVLGYFLSQSMTQYQEVADGYDQAVKTLHTLQNRAPFPSQANLETAKNAQSAYKTELDTLRGQLASMQAPLNASIKPQQFQDDLRQAVNDLTSKALAAGVKLPENFYLGFNQYEATPPTDQAAPALARQLGIINRSVTRLIEYKVESIDDLKRAPLPEEAGAARVSGGGKGGNNATPPLFIRYPFDISFTTDQSKFRIALNSLLETEQFLILRSLNIRNTNPAGPPVTDPSTASGTSESESAGETKSNLNVILGRESLKVALRIEIIDFTKLEQK